MGTPFEEEERTNTKADPRTSPEPVALGADAAPTSVALGAEPAAPTSVVLGEAGPTSVLPWPSNDVPIPRELESTTVVPWPVTADRGPPVQLSSGPTEPGVNIPPPFPRELPSSSRAVKKPNSPPVMSSPPAPNVAAMMFNQMLPNSPPVPIKPPTGFVALGTDIDPQETKVQAQVSPLLISRPKASMRGRLAKRLSVELRIPAGDGKARVRVYGIIAVTALIALGLMVGTFKLVSWALTEGIESRKKPVVVQPGPKKRK